MHDVEKHSAILVNVAGFARLDGGPVTWLCGTRCGLVTKWHHWGNKLRVPLEPCTSWNAPLLSS